MIGPSRRTWRWVATPCGVFAAAFPGFVLGFFATGDGIPAGAPRGYLARAIALPEPAGALLKAAVPGLIAIWWWRAWSGGIPIAAR